MIRRLLLRLSGYMPAREIKGPNGEPYLERYYVGRLFGWTFYLHRFLAGDPDRGLHDHPWDVSISLVLSGGYSETRLTHIDCTGVHTRTRRVRPGRLNIIRADTFHRVEFGALDTEAWSLFMAHRKLQRKRWGFLFGPFGHGLPSGDFVVEFVPYVGTVDSDWHLRAPTGRDLRRLQNTRAWMDGTLPYYDLGKDCVPSSDVRRR